MSAKLKRSDAYGVCKWCKEEEARQADGEAGKPPKGDITKKRKGKKTTAHAPVCNTILPGLCICEVCGKPYNQHEG